MPNFSTKIDPSLAKEPITFDGQMLDDEGKPDVDPETGQPRTFAESFRVLPELPGGVLDELMRSVSNVEGGEVRYHRLSVIRFLDKVIVPADRERFAQLMDDPHRIVAVEALGAAVDYLTNEDTGRPTRR